MQLGNFAQRRGQLLDKRVAITTSVDLAGDQLLGLVNRAKQRRRPPVSVGRPGIAPSFAEEIDERERREPGQRFTGRPGTQQGERVRIMRGRQGRDRKRAALGDAADGKRLDAAGRDARHEASADQRREARSGRAVQYGEPVPPPQAADLRRFRRPAEEDGRVRARERPVTDVGGRRPLPAGHRACPRARVPISGSSPASRLTNLPMPHDYSPASVRRHSAGNSLPAPASTPA